MRKLASIKRINEDRLPSPTPAFSEENFKIYLRVKPSDGPTSDSNLIKIHSNTKVEIVSPYYSASEADKIYNYEEVFAQGTSNDEVFQRSMLQPIENALRGYNSTVFIYGMTGAGKTYTMFGNFGSISGRNYEEEGLVSKTIDYMFEQVQKEPEVKTQVQVSFYEIYNENIKDLMQE